MRTLQRCAGLGKRFATVWSGWAQIRYEIPSAFVAQRLLSASPFARLARRIARSSGPARCTVKKGSELSIDTVEYQRSYRRFNRRITAQRQTGIKALRPQRAEYSRSVLRFVRSPAHSLLPSSLYLDRSHCLVLAPAILAALPSTRAIPDRDVFYVARPTRSIHQKPSYRLS
jgi:hypothetical protein